MIGQKITFKVLGHIGLRPLYNKFGLIDLFILLIMLLCVGIMILQTLNLAGHQFDTALLFFLALLLQNIILLDRINRKEIILILIDALNRLIQVKRVLMGR